MSRLPPAREFHDLAELKLNLESATGTAWANLGDWSTAGTYPEACAHLACRVGDAARLGPQTRLADLGFGCGEQLKLWQNHYGVRQMTGLNISLSQTQYALGHAPPPSARLLQADAAELPAHCSAGSLDAVVALDCAYHFSNRRRVWAQSFTCLQPGGRLAFTDLLRPASAGRWQRAAALGLARASQIPAANLRSARAYRTELEELGFREVQVHCLTQAVLAGFAAWWPGYRQRYGPQIPRREQTKFALTAHVLGWASRHGVLDYALISATRPQS